MEFSTDQIRAYLTSYQHLRDDTSLKGNEGIKAFVKQAGCVQFDPLDQVGNNHDLVFQSRIENYRKGDANRLIYSEKPRTLFDTWDKNMSIALVEDRPCFSRIMNSGAHWGNTCSREQESKIMEYLQDHEYVSSSDLDFPGSRKALEFLAYHGALTVHHKVGTRRFLALSGKLLPPEILQKEDPNRTWEQYWAWYVFRRLCSTGILASGPSDAFLGLYGSQSMKSGNRKKAFDDLQKSGKVTEIICKGLKAPLYIPSKCLSLLENATPAKEDEPVRFLAPLDNLIWDRRLTAKIFGFEYTWEVYVPQPKRKYGYYVLPVLRGDNFCGRIEFEFDKKKSRLGIKNFWPERPVTGNTDFQECFVKGLKRFSAYLGMVDLVFQKEIN